MSKLKTLKEEAALAFVEVKLKVQKWWEKLCEIVGQIVVGVVLPLLKVTADLVGAVALGAGAVAVGGALGVAVTALAVANPVGVMVAGVGLGVVALTSASGGSRRRRRRRR